MSSYQLNILKSLREEDISMCHFLLLTCPHLCSGEGKKVRKYIVSYKLEQSFILMIEEKAFANFIITGVLIILFSGFYLYKYVHDEEIT